tara:strand:- start:245 stop:1018 length:774 start_codon:yes stop_codon:yes gene_type:complete
MDIFYTIINSAPGVPDWAFVVLCIASFFTSIVSASLGLGGGAMMVAVMASLVPPLAVIPVHAVVQVFSNITRAALLWKHIDFTWMMPFLLGTVIGAFVGGQIVFAIPKHLLQSIIGLFVLYTLWGPAVKAIKPSFITFVWVGSFASFATMFVGGTGPLIAPFIKASTTERQMTVATHGVFMFWQHGIKIIIFGFLGFAFAPYVTMMVAMILFGSIGVVVGKRILTKMPEHIFKKLFNTILVMLAIWLLYEGFTGYFL